MCGIVGILGNDANESFLLNMRDSLLHRGPDACGIFFNAEARVGMAHRRLRIIDATEKSDQPFTTPDSDYVLVHNGEIYNFRQLRRELETSGEKFFTDSDTEVVLKSYIHWGEKCVDKFEGMFAFAIWDGSQRRLKIFRDRFGVKPLYWWHNGTTFAFASEAKALLRHPKIEPSVDYYGLANFLEFGYIPSPRSAFQGIQKLLPGHYLIVNKDATQVKIRRWWNSSHFFEKTISGDEDELVEQLETLLATAFSRRMVANELPGIFLSGGIDSSALVAILADNYSRLKTFTIGFAEAEYDESSFAQRVAELFGTEHTEYRCTADDVRDVIAILPQIYDEPFGDQSAVPTYLVAKLASQSVKVALSAEGGDEMFAGYSRYALTKRWIAMPKLYRTAISAMPEFITKKLLNAMGIMHSNNKARRAKWLAGQKNIGQIYRAAVRYFSPAEIQRLVGVEPNLSQTQLTEIPNGISPIRAMRIADILSFLPDDILVKTDRATMAVSIEGREPFLDTDLFKFAAALPDDILLRDGGTKYILKKTLRKYLPDELLNRPKLGFGMPLEKWLPQELYGMANDILSPERIAETLVLNSAEARRHLKKLKSQDSSQLDVHRVWLLMMLQLWSENWLVNK